MVPDNRILLEEWKERYASYRQYRGQYLTTLSIATTGLLIAGGVALKDDTLPLLRTTLLAVILLIALGLVIAHVIARTAVAELGRRIEKLQVELEMDGFQTTRPLERALVVTLWGSVLAFLLALGVSASVWLRGL